MRNQDSPWIRKVIHWRWELDMEVERKPDNGQVFHSEGSGDLATCPKNNTGRKDQSQSERGSWRFSTAGEGGRLEGFLCVILTCATSHCESWKEFSCFPSPHKNISSRCSFVFLTHLSPIKAGPLSPTRKIGFPKCVLIWYYDMKVTCVFLQGLVNCFWKMVIIKKGWKCTVIPLLEMLKGPFLSYNKKKLNKNSPKLSSLNFI